MIDRGLKSMSVQTQNIKNFPTGAATIQKFHLSKKYVQKKKKK